MVLDEYFSPLFIGARDATQELRQLLDAVSPTSAAFEGEDLFVGVSGRQVCWIRPETGPSGPVSGCSGAFSGLSALFGDLKAGAAAEKPM